VHGSGFSSSPRASRSTPPQRERGSPPASPPGAGDRVSRAGLTSAREKSPEGAAVWLTPCLSLTVLSAQGEIWGSGGISGSGGGGHPITCPAAGPRGPATFRTTTTLQGCFTPLPSTAHEIPVVPRLPAGLLFLRGSREIQQQAFTGLLG